MRLIKLNYKQWLRHAWVPLFVLLVSLSLTGVAAYYANSSVNIHDQFRFRRAVNMTQATIRNRLAIYIALLRSSGGLFKLKPTVDRQTFHDYVQNLDLPHNYPGVQGIGFSVRIRPEQRADLIRQIRRQGATAFVIHPAFNRAEYHTILYLEPLDYRNNAAIGYDMFTDPVRRAAMEQARDTGEVTASGKVTLVQEIDRHRQAGFVIYFPVYKRGTSPQSTAERRAALSGFVYSAFRTDDLLNGIFGNDSNHTVDFQIFDGSAPIPQNLLYESRLPIIDKHFAYHPRWTAAVTILIAGRHWTLVFASRPEFEMVSEREMGCYVLIGGILISALLFIVVGAQAWAKVAAEKMAFKIEKSTSALQESEGYLELAVQAGEMGLWNADLTTGRVTLSRGHEILLGYKAGDFGGTFNDFLACVHPDDRAQFLEPNRQAQIREGYFGNEFRIIRPDGSVRWLASRGRFLYDTNGKEMRVTGAAMDITELKRAQEEQQKFVALIENSSDFIGMLALDGQLTFLNSAARRLIGLEDDKEIQSLFLWDLCPAPTGPLLPETVLPTILSTGHWAGEVQLRHLQTAELIDVNISTFLVRDQHQGDPICIAAIARDIRDRKRAEQEIIEAWQAAEQSQAELEAMNGELENAVTLAQELIVAAEAESYAKSALFSALPSILISFDPDGCIRQWNYAAEQIFGLAADAVVDKPLTACPIGWDQDILAEKIQQCCRLNRTVRIDDMRFTRPNGSEGFLGASITPVSNAHGQVTTLLLLGADITERKFLESQLAHAQKLESIGQLAAGIAHEINTPTQFIGDNIRFLQETFHDLTPLLKLYDRLLQDALNGTLAPPLLQQVQQAQHDADVAYLLKEAPQAIEQALEGTARVAKIVQAMKEFSHPGTQEKTAIDLNRAIESTITVARNEWKYVAEVLTDFDPMLPAVPCLPGDFNQVILNLLINAAHAIAEVVGEHSGELGQIRVSTRCVEEWAEVRIGDTGTGIAEGVRAKVFDPFFTTKEVGKGTGQGLAIAHSIVVDKHGGRIWFETEEGAGTTFVIRLPLEAESAQQRLDAA